MLVIRELLLGPKRFKHLLAALPRSGANRLSERLRGLEEAGIIRKTTLPAPAPVAVHELTAEGKRLRGPLIALGLWGSISRSMIASTRRRLGHSSSRSARRARSFS